ncbi:MAG: cache domain-containing protein [Proteobacteria bacterium]|nr:cache domain-containing protein [Pseudomonadota bacterium]
MKTHDELYRQYTFRVTRELVKTVTEAKTLLEEKGDKAFPLLDRMKSDQLGLYLYVYRSSDGLCLYHGENRALVGTRLDRFTDQLGKPLHKLISREIKNPFNRHGWVHYYWNRPHGLFL